MVTMVLLIIIYLAFISLGLPDALLGVAWPLIREDWQMGLDAVGLIAIVITGGTISSSLLSGKLINRFGEGKITLISGLLTGGALLGFSLAPSYLWFVLLALPLGFGAGSVDTALNHYVALHFKAHHMNWLHSFWGVGATAGPVLMALILGKTGSWRQGYQTVAIIQLILAAIIFVSLPLWKKQAMRNEIVAEHDENEFPVDVKGALELGLDSQANKNSSGRAVFRIKGVPFALMIFMFYCAAEYAMGLWGSSYLVQTRGIPLETAARWVAFYYAGITVGRILSGFISFKLNNQKMIQLGIGIAFLGASLLVLNLNNTLVMISFIFIGLGFAPIFPSMIHETPSRFGKSGAQSVIGYQMASAYIGIAVFPPLLGVAIERTSMILFPFFILSCVLALFLLSQKLNGLTRK